MRRGYRRKRLRRLMAQLADVWRTFSVAHRKTRGASLNDTGSFHWSHYAAAR
jgi:hypothetical protein